MPGPTGFIEVDLFPPEVDSAEHPDALTFRELLEDVADEYNCSLVHFEIESGTAVFSFDSEELMANIINILEYEERHQT